MGLLDLLTAPAQTRQNINDLLNSESWGPFGALDGLPTVSGAPVGPVSSMRLGAVYACVRVIAETISTLPFPVYQESEPGTREVVRDHPTYALLNYGPTEQMVATIWRELMVADITLWGNHYAEIKSNSAGQVVGLERWSPITTRVMMVNGRLKYQRRDENGLETPGKPVDQFNMIHIPGFGFNGIMGISVIQFARESIGVGLAALEYGGRWFGSGARPAGVFVHPETMSPKAKLELAAQWHRAFGGVSRSHGTAVLEGGIKWERIGVPPNDAQFLETREHTDRDIAKMFRVPGHMIGIRDNQPRANVTQDAIDFVTHTIRPWCVRIETHLNEKLFRRRGDPSHFCEHKVNGLMRGDSKARFAGYAMARQAGWLSINDIRRMENLNPIPEGGDEYNAPLNMVPASMFGDNIEGSKVLEASIRASFHAACVRVNKKASAECAKAEGRLGGSTTAYTEWSERFYRDNEGAIDAAFRPILSGVASVLGTTLNVGFEDVAATVNDALQRLYGLRASERVDPECVAAMCRSTVGFISDSLAKLRGEPNSLVTRVPYPSPGSAQSFELRDIATLDALGGN